MKRLTPIILSLALTSCLFGCANFINRLNGSVEQEEHIIVVLPRAPAPSNQSQQVKAVTPNAPYRGPSMGTLPQVSGIFTATQQSPIRVAPGSNSGENAFRQKDVASAIADLTPSATPAKPQESATKNQTAAQTTSPPPVVEIKPSQPVAPPAPLQPPVPPATPKTVTAEVLPPAVAMPAPAPLAKPSAPRNDTPNPDSLGGLIARRAVYYDFDTASLSDEYKSIVIAHAKYLAQNPKAKLKLRGNCDERGSHEYNISLGSNRAESVKQLMMANGAAAKQIETESFGKEKPMATGHDEQSWAKNRRVDILYSEEE